MGVRIKTDRARNKMGREEHVHQVPAAQIALIRAGLVRVAPDLPVPAVRGGHARPTQAIIAPGVRGRQHRGHVPKEGHDLAVLPAVIVR